MTIIIQNQTAGTLSYLGGLVSVSGNSNTTVPSQYLYPISRDPGLINDCSQDNVRINDSIQIYTITSAIGYLNTVATSIGGAVIGLIGSPAPNYAILVGSKDGSGNVQSATIDSNGGIIVAGEGVSGTPAGGILTVQGKSGMTSINVAGDIASGNADSGYPIKVGAVYNSSLPTPSSGQREDSQCNQFGENAIQFRNKYRHLTGNATTTIKSGSGRLHSICINNNTTGGTVTIYDNTAGSGTTIMALTAGTPSGGLLSTSGQSGPVFLGPMGLEFSTGLTITTAGSGSNDITVCYQ